jgi:Fungal specific transcription factor domain
MIELHGGIDTLPRDLALQMSRSVLPLTYVFVTSLLTTDLSVDSNMAWMRRSKPRLPMYKSRFRENGPLVSAVDICSRSASDVLPSNRRYLSTRPLSSPFQSTKLEAFLWEELFSTACELHGLTYMLDLYVQQPSKIGPIQREFFEDSFAAVQYSLVAFPYPTDFSIMKSTTYFRQHSWRIAAMIYFNSAIRTWDRASDMVRSMVAQLISSLRVSDTYSMWSTFPEVLLWIVFMGSSAAWDRVERAWLVFELRYGVNLLGLRSIDELEELLKSFLYRKSMLHASLCTIWQEINP